jgi:hypothetical protein
MRCRVKLRMGQRVTEQRIEEDEEESAARDSDGGMDIGVGRELSGGELRLGGKGER